MASLPIASNTIRTAIPLRAANPNASPASAPTPEPRRRRTLAPQHLSALRWQGISLRWSQQEVTIAIPGHRLTLIAPPETRFFRALHQQLTTRDARPRPAPRNAAPPAARSSGTEFARTRSGRHPAPRLWSPASTLKQPAGSGSPIHLACRGARLKLTDPDHIRFFEQLKQHLARVPDPYRASIVAASAHGDRRPALPAATSTTHPRVQLNPPKPAVSADLIDPSSDRTLIGAHARLHRNESFPDILSGSPASPEQPLS
jgi:hypothetical protein